MIISNFLDGLFGAAGQTEVTKSVGLPQQRASRDVELGVLREALDSMCQDSDSKWRTIHELRAMYAAAESRAVLLHGKLEDVRPYLVAAAKGSSLQARGDLAALDAVLRSTKP